jgi:nitrogen fixation/metabolism regulation signal transduction histidine kinase
MESGQALPYPRGESPGRGWPGILEAPALVGVGFALAVTLTAAAVGLGSSPSLSGPLGPASPLVQSLLWGNLVLILALGALVARKVVRLVGAQSADAGARLHLRFVALFATAAVAPALVVALFFGVLVTNGVDSWFNARVQNVVENSRNVAVSYLEEQKLNIGKHATLIARDLNSAGPSQLASSPVVFSQFLMGQAEDNGFIGAYVIDRHGRRAARRASWSRRKRRFVSPTRATLRPRPSRPPTCSAPSTGCAPFPRPISTSSGRSSPGSSPISGRATTRSRPIRRPRPTAPRSSSASS